MQNVERARQLRDVVRFMVRKLGIMEDGGLACCRISLPQCHALVEIGRAGSISLVELAKLLNLDNSTMSRTVNNLVQCNMVERELDPNDRRYVTIRLTPAGKRSFLELEEKMEQYFSQVLSRIPGEKQEQVLDSLHMLLKALSETECCPEKKDGGD